MVAGWGLCSAASSVFLTFMYRIMIIYFIHLPDLTLWYCQKYQKSNQVNQSECFPGSDCSGMLKALGRCFNLLGLRECWDAALCHRVWMMLCGAGVWMQ